jgi:eukaryotic-like serine/threonine-protein kinase
MAASRTDLVQRAKARLGTVLKDKFRLESVLGVGGMATVYAALHRNGKKVAVKLLHPVFAADPDLVNRFLREGYVANKIEHPGCVNVLDDDTDGDSVFLVMELLEGQSLEKFTRPGGPRMPLETVLRVADETLDVLAVAHSRGITHRDLKPANLFLTQDGRTKVLDFGIARLADGGIDGTATQTGIAIGTPAFMPPEQARGRKQEIDGRTDLWSLGATMLALLAGDRPRRAETGEEELLLAMTAPMPAVRERVPSVPTPVAAVIDRALAFDRLARWPDARSMQVALRDAAHAVSSMHVEPPTPQVDTAPVLTVGAAPGQDPTTQLATGSTLVGQRVGRPSGARRALWSVFAASFTVALGLAVVLWVALARRGTEATLAAVQAVPAMSAPVVPPGPSMSSVAPEVSAQPPASAAVDLDTPAPSGSAHRVAPSRAARPAPASTPGSTNPFDQRF